MFVDGENADGIVGEQNLTEDQEIGAVLDNQALAAIDRGFLGFWRSSPALKSNFNVSHSNTGRNPRSPWNASSTRRVCEPSASSW
jgi:hypothetical protein